MKILRAYRYRLYPSKEQEQQLKQQCGNCRFLWNRFLDMNQRQYETTGKFVFAHELIISIPELKKEYEFLGLTFSQSLQQVGRFFDRALKSFIAGICEFPKHKKKKYQDGLTVPQKFRLNKKYVFIPKIGEVQWVKHRPYKGKVKSITIKQDGDQWYCSVLCELKIKRPKTKTDDVVGVDVGLKTFATLSDGITVPNERVLRKHERKLNKAQRILFRRKKGGQNRNKQRVKVAKIHRKVRHVRSNFQHQITSRMIAKYDGFALETLNIEDMMKNHNLAKSIADVGWYSFKQKLKYKSEWNGKMFLEIGTFEPSSKICHCCGWKDTDQMLQDRKFCCEQCGMEIDRDLNAAINIRNIAMKNIPWDAREFTLGDDKRLQSDNDSACRRAKKKQCLALTELASVR